ncbi:MAG: LLM class F420-dependent oxidoreductase [Chloroflexota bacterium]|nr:LLM class F420-dependent oxidoreductase [Chloroflexota bacterium]
MKIGLQIPRFDWPGSPQNIGPKLVEIARAADRAGFSSLWVMDHFFQIGHGYGPIDAPMLEGYSTMSYLAAATERTKVGLLVTGAFYRHSGILIKTVTTLDVLSGGRACLGIGAGWNGHEARGLGVPFPSLGDRFKRLEETLQIAKQMWKGDQSPFEGAHYRLEEPINSPQPLSQPHPPILIGGEGEKKTLRLVAKYGDACNLRLGSPLKGFTQTHKELFQNRKERLPRKLDILKRHCYEVGRSYDEIEPTVLGPVLLAPDAMTPAELVEICQELAEMGFQQYIFSMSNVHEIEPIEIIGCDVIPAVYGL